MRHYDGFQINEERPGLTLVFFGERDLELQYELIQSLGAFFDTLKDDLPLQPAFSCWSEPEPEEIPAVHQEQAYFPVLDLAGGNIILGITATGFFNPYLGRCIFGYGRPDGLGVLSTFRFRKECGNRHLYFDRLKKQIIKTLAMACSMSACNDEGCIVSYHRHVADLDHNHYVCPSCRKEFTRNLSFFLDVPTSNEGTSREAGGAKL